MCRIGVVLALLVGALTMVVPVATAEEEIAVLDDCDPNDSGWAPTGGCTLEDGNVNVAEFGSPSVLPEGHPAWRNEPSYIKIEPGETVEVTNDGGRGHTFTKVAAFGGGFVPPLNNPPFSAAVPECDTAAEVFGPTFLPPGASLEVTGLGTDTPFQSHLFQCCFHPWMRAVIKVKEDVD